MSELDINLIKKCVDGDLKSFDQLISRYERNAFAMALRYLGNYDDASDVTQEALIKVYKNISKFRFEASFTTWLYRIVINTAKDFLKKKNREKVVSIDETQKEFKDENKDQNPQEHTERQEVKSEVHRALDKISENYRMVIVLKDIQGFTYDQISEMLEIPIGTVRSRISRGRVELKKEILRANPDILSMIG
jgi:RNA polymerase sigma-70 factor (ECF subfamily)